MADRYLIDMALTVRDSRTTRGEDRDGGAGELIPALREGDRRRPATIATRVIVMSMPPIAAGSLGLTAAIRVVGLDRRSRAHRSR